MDCIYNIPICGGFCAPTRSSESSCYRHVSNEYTLPAGKLLPKLLPVLETSMCCRRFGRIGTTWAGRNRKIIGTVLSTANALAIPLLIFAAFGMTTDPAVLRRTYWVHGRVTIPFPDELHVPDGHLVLETYIGTSMHFDSASCEETVPEATCREVLRSAGFEAVDGVYYRSARWSDTQYCDKDSGLFAGMLSDEEAAYRTEHCEECRGSQVASSALIFSVLGQLPTLTTNLQRATRYGDINCQKFFGVLSNLMTFVTTLAAIVTFSQGCYKNLPRERFGATMQWSHGMGFLFLFFATCVKVPDAIFHLLIPTPGQRWQKPVGPIEDLADYMDLEEAATPPITRTYHQDLPVLDTDPPLEMQTELQLTPDDGKNEAEESTPAPETSTADGAQAATADAVEEV